MKCHVMLHFIWVFNVVFVLANTADPDEMPGNAAFHLGVQCLHKFAFRGYTKGETVWLASEGLEYVIHTKYMKTSLTDCLKNEFVNEPRHEISNNVVCATSIASDQPALCEV